MSKTRDTGFLGNVVKVDNSGNITFVNGSTTLATINTSGQFSGSSSVLSALSSSYSVNSDNLGGLGSTSFTTTSSFSSVSSSISGRVKAIEDQYSTTGSNTFTGTQNISNTTSATNFDSTAALYTAGGMRVTKNVYFSSSLYIKGDLTVYGTQSINYITSSQLDISDNIINVNTATPGIRFGGIAVYDSGSTGLTGSFLWDSQNNKWIYSNPSGSSYDGGMAIFGPRNSNGLGNEQGTTNNALMKGQGGDHITSSLITEDGNLMSVYSTMYVSSSGAVGIGTTTPASEFHIYRPTPYIRFTDSNATGNNGNVYLYAIKDGVGYNNMTTVAYTHTWKGGGSETTYMTLNSAGSLGIGTSSPTYTLHVNGTSFFSNTASFDNTVNIGNANISWGYSDRGIYLSRAGLGPREALISRDASTSWWVDVGGSSDWSGVTLAKNGGNVGIGVTNPNGKLQFSNATNTRKIVLYQGGNNDYEFYGFGVESAKLIYSTYTTSDDHVFVAGTSGTSRNELMRIKGNGQILRPSQPAFLAYNSSGISITGGGWYNISNAITSESYDVGSNYSSGGTFTAPVAGKYLFYFGGWSSISSNGERYAVCARVNGGGLNFIGGGNYCLTDSPLSGYQIVRDLAAGDYVELWAFSAVSGTWGGGSHYIFWGGYLL